MQARVKDLRNQAPRVGETRDVGPCKEGKCKAVMGKLSRLG